MNRVYGMTLKQFDDVIQEMKSIYPFEDDKAYIGNLHEMSTDMPSQVEIHTKDEKTGIKIVMLKGVDLEALRN